MCQERFKLGLSRLTFGFSAILLQGSRKKQQLWIMPEFFAEHAEPFLRKRCFCAAASLSCSLEPSAALC